MQATKSPILPSRNFSNSKAFHWDFDRRNEAYSYGWQKSLRLNVEKFINKMFFGNFGLSGLWYNEQNQRFFTSILLYKCYVLDWVHDGGIRTCSSWAIQVWKLTELKKSNSSWNFRTVKALTRGTQMGNSPIEKCPTARMFSLPTLIEKVKPVVLVKYEIEHREKLKSKCFFFGTFGLLRYWCKREK